MVPGRVRCACGRHGTCAVSVIAHPCVMERPMPTRWLIAVAAVVLVVAGVDLALHEDSDAVRSNGGQSVLIEARVNGQSQYCSGVAVRGLDGVLTAAHCVSGGAVTLVEWADREWRAGSVIFGAHDTAFIRVAGIGDSVGAVGVGELAAGGLTIQAWQGATRSSRTVGTCAARGWVTQYAQLSVRCGFRHGGSGAGVMQGAKVVAIVTSQTGGGNNVATLLQHSGLLESVSQAREQ
jgi:hypothetical protein